MTIDIFGFFLGDKIFPETPNILSQQFNFLIELNDLLVRSEKVLDVSFSEYSLRFLLLVWILKGYKVFNISLVYQSHYSRNHIFLFTPSMLKCSCQRIRREQLSSSVSLTSSLCVSDIFDDPL